MGIRLSILSMFVAWALLCAATEMQKSQEDVKDDGNANTEQTADDDRGFERYQSIIDRQPFGPPPPGFDPSLPVGQSASGGSGGPGEKTEAEISAEEQKIMSSVRVSILNVTPAGAVMVGFTDSTTQPPVNYYLKVGDTSTDSAKWTVKDADPAVGTVTLSKDGIDVTLAVGGETKKGAPVGKPALAGNGAGALGGHRGPRNGINRGLLPASSSEGPGGGPAAEAGMGGGPLARLRHRRMLQQAEEAAQKQSADKARAELEAREREERAQEREQAAAEREQQREALLQIQEELRRQRESKALQKAENEAETNDNSDE